MPERPITGHRLLIAPANTVAQRKISEEVSDGRKRRQGEREPPQAIHAGEIPDVQIRVEDRPAAPERLGVQEPDAPRVVRAARIGGARARLQSRRRAIRRLVERAVRGGGIPARDRSREGRGREDPLLPIGQGDPAVGRDGNQRQQDEPGGAGAGSCTAAQPVERDDGRDPVEARLGQRPRKLASRDRGDHRRRADRRRREPTGARRIQRGGQRCRRKQRGDRKQPPRRRLAAEAIDGEPGGDRQARG